jgi:AcrR family transcriptional regulator
MAPRRRVRSPTAPARDRLIAAADELFSRDGIAATPVDEAIRRAGVATATLYHHFYGKDALVAAYLRDRHERWMRRWERHIAAAADPAAALLAIFDALDEWEREGGAARGCAFVDAAAELSDRSHPAWREISAHKDGVRDRLVELARPRGWWQACPPPGKPPRARRTTPPHDACQPGGSRTASLPRSGAPPRPPLLERLK